MVSRLFLTKLSQPISVSIYFRWASATDEIATTVSCDVYHIDIEEGTNTEEEHVTNNNVTEEIEEKQWEHNLVNFSI